MPASMTSDDGAAPGDSGTAQHGTQARREFAGGAGLRHIVVRAEVEPCDTVGAIAARGEHDHGDLAGAADTAQGIGAVQARHHDVQNDNRKFAGYRPFRARAAVARGFHLEAFLVQKFREQSREFDVVVDEQNLGHGQHCNV